ncbi:MAG: SDR family NAD(P)-dependent oxidoreductase [Ginsengibacter sp.]
MKKTVIVTGASGNLGRAIVKKFSHEEYHVAAIVHHKDKKKDVPENDIEKTELDLLNEDVCQKTIEDIISKNKVIDVAVLAAGGFTSGNVASTKIVDIANQIQLNFETAYNMARPVFLQMMKQNSGRIFLIGSRQGLDTNNAKGVTAYALSKSLLFGLAEIMNAEAKNKNVVVSVIVPGTIDTPQNRKSMPDADFSAWVSPAKIAEVIYFYSGEAADIIREPVIKVYGRS